MQSKIIEENNVRYIVDTDDTGNIIWYEEKTRILHRENGPAIEYFDGGKEWYKYGEPHRDDGPAFEFADGRKEYWLYGDRLPNISTDEELLIKLLLE